MRGKESEEVSKILRVRSWEAMGVLGKVGQGKDKGSTDRRGSGELFM